MSIQYPIPVTIILVVVSIYLFNNYNRKKKAVNEDRRERLQDVRQKYLEMTLQQSKKSSIKNNEAPNPEKES